MAVELRKLLQLAVDKETGELRFTVGAPPSVRLRSGLRPLNLPVLTPEDTLRFLKGMAPVTGMQEFKDEGACSFDFAFDTTASFRVTAFLQENPDPSLEEIREGISGNLCRCTGYQGIIKAVQHAAAAGRSVVTSTEGN